MASNKNKNEDSVFNPKESSDGDSWDAEDERLLRNIGDHPLLERIQISLQKQLEERLDRVTAELREKTEASTRAQTQRENIGVELYGVQQHLAKLQLQLDNAQQKSEALAQVREKAENDLKKFQEGYEDRRKHVRTQRKKLIQLKSDLNALQATMRQIEAYNKEMQDEIALTRRATYKAEEEAQGIEKAKADQDLYIDRMNERITYVREQIVLYEAQIASQRDETRTAQETLQEAEKEMEQVQFEKKQLFAQWQSSLIGMRRRDEAVEQVQKALQEQREAFESMNAEENNTRKLIRESQDRHATLQEVYDKEQSQLRWLETQISQMKRQFTALDEQQAMLQSSEASADAEIARLTTQRDSLEKELRDLQDARQRADRKRQDIENELAANANVQTTVQKAARNMAKETKRILQQIHEREMEKAVVENELARAKVDQLNTEAHNAALRDSLQQLEKEISEKDSLVAKYQMEIRQRHDAIEKKMHIVDRLNRKYERLASSAPEEENMGPLEATIHNLSKQCEELRKSCDELQKRWLTEQAELVDRSSAIEARQNRHREMNSQYVLLDQKRIRLEAAVTTQRKDIEGLRNGIKNMHEDMGRINGLIAKNESLAKKLSESAYTAEKDFTEELKELERDSVASEAKVAGIKDEKADLLGDLEELERQVVMWEKKIKLEREMQQALDPTEGESEVQSMEREIHRMRLRLDTLKRDQERLLKEMERAVEKHEAIALKFRARKDGNIKGGAYTKAGVEKKMVAVKRDLARKQEKLQGFAAALDKKEQEAESVRAVTRQEESELVRLEEEAAEIQKDINAGLYEKQKGVEKVANLQRKIARLKGFIDGSRPTVARSNNTSGATGKSGARSMTADEVDAMYEQATERRETVRAMVGALIEQHPDLQGVLDRVAQLLDI